MLALRILISAALIGFLVATLDMRAVAAALLSFSPGAIGLGLALMATAHLVNTWRWWRLLPQARYLRLLQLNLVALYYSIVLPGLVAGELVKAYRAGKESHDRERAYASILVDKLVGMLAVAVMGLVAGMLGASFDGLWLRGPLAGIVLVLVALAGLPFVGSLVHLGAGLWRSPPRWVVRLVSLSRDVLSAIRRYWRDRPTMLLVTAVGLVAQTAMAGIIYVLVTDHYPGANVFDVCFVFSIVSLLMILPLSVAGIGVREAGMVAMLPQLGISPEDALAISLVSFFINACYAVVGAWVDLRDGVRPAASNHPRDRDGTD